MIGRKNMAFGFIYILATLGLGVYLAILMEAGDAAFLESETRSVIRSVHAHGNLESVLNILIGYLLCRLSLDVWLAKAVSWLLIVGALLHSGMLYLDALGIGWAASVAPVGALCLVAVMPLMAYGVIRLKNAG